MSAYATFKKQAKQVLDDAKMRFDSNGDYAEMVNAFGIGQVNDTLLAEEVVAQYGIDTGWLDEEGSSLWEAVADVAREFETDTGAPH